MPVRRNRQAQSIAVKTAEIAFAAPQVVAHRVARIAMAGPTLSARDRKEFQLMGAEKLAAFTQSWNAMAMQSMRAQQVLAADLLRALWSPWTIGHPSKPSARMAVAVQGATLGVLSKGIAPVHRKATANARRLARTKLALMNDVAVYAGEKGNLKFPLDRPIPYALIGRIVKARVRENRLRAEARKNKR